MTGSKPGDRLPENISKFIGYKDGFGIQGKSDCGRFLWQLSCKKGTWMRLEDDTDGRRMRKTFGLEGSSYPIPILSIIYHLPL